MALNFNKNEIRNNARPEFVAEALGLQIKNMGRNKSILCLCHPDKHFGSCFLTQKGFKCFSCGAEGDVFDMVVASKNVDFPEACQFLGELLGLTPEHPDAKNKKVKRVLDDESLRMIGLVAPRDSRGMYTTVGCYDENENFNLENRHFYEWYPSKQNIYAVYEIIDSNPLQTLLQSDEKAYRSLIFEKSRAAYFFYKAMETFIDENGFVFDEKRNKKILELLGKENFISYLKKLQQRCYELMCEYSKKEG